MPFPLPTRRDDWDFNGERDDVQLSEIDGYLGLPLDTLRWIKEHRELTGLSTIALIRYAIWFTQQASLISVVDMLSLTPVTPSTTVEDVTQALTAYDQIQKRLRAGGGCAS